MSASRINGRYCFAQWTRYHTEATKGALTATAKVLREHEVVLQRDVARLKAELEALRSQFIHKTELMDLFLIPDCPTLLKAKATATAAAAATVAAAAAAATTAKAKGAATGVAEGAAKGVAGGDAEGGENAENEETVFDASVVRSGQAAFRLLEQVLVQVMGQAGAVEPTPEFLATAVDHFEAMLKATPLVIAGSDGSGDGGSGNGNDGKLVADKGCQTGTNDTDGAKNGKDSRARRGTNSWGAGPDPRAGITSVFTTMGKICEKKVGADRADDAKGKPVEARDRLATYTREFFLNEYGVASIANNKLLSFRGGIAKHAAKFKRAWWFGWMMCDGCLDDQQYSDDRLTVANGGDANVVVRCFPMMIDLFLFFLTRIMKEEAIAEKMVFRPKAPDMCPLDMGDVARAITTTLGPFQSIDHDVTIAALNAGAACTGLDDVMDAVLGNWKT